jgi:hypothetical protein
MILFVILYIILQSKAQNRDRRGRDRMVVGYPTTCAVSV